MVTAKKLLIASTESSSGKTATILGIVSQLQKQGLSIAYGKPLGTCFGKDTGAEPLPPREMSVSDAATDEEDVRFIKDALKLSDRQVRSPLLNLDRQTINRRLQGEDTTNYSQSLPQYVQTEANLMLLEGPGTLWEGSLFDLSVRQMVQAIDASVLLIGHYSAALVDSFLAAKATLGDRLLAVSINNIPPDDLEAANLVKSFLERQGIEVLGMLPSNNLLRSVSVRELCQQLGAKVLCRSDRLDLMVESLCIGAMNVNSALEYFRQRRNMAVVTGGDRTDLQLAALETSTHCLILTGHVPPQPLILSRAEDLEIPILTVNLDTLSTVEIVDRAFGHVRLQEPIKVQCIQQLMQEYFDIDRLMNKLGLEPAVLA